MLNVKLVRLSTGEDVITNVIEDTDSYVKFKNPIVAFPSQEGRIGFAPWSPLIDKTTPETVSYTHLTLPTIYSV